jgi:hypothetical protein
VHGDQLSDSTRGGCTSIGGCLDGTDVAANEHRHVAGADIFGSDEHDIGRLDHGIGGLDGSNESAGLHHSKRIAVRFHLVDPDDIMGVLNMQRTVFAGGLGRLRLTLVVCAIACVTASCSRRDDTGPAVATAHVGVARSRIAQGSPVEMTYRFEVANDLSASGNHRVFVHVVDADEELMWTDDHEPPTATTSWKAGQTVEYMRTMFVPMYPYVGPAKVILGLYDTNTNARLKLANADRGDRSYQVANFELLPQTENVYLIYKDGWHPAEVAPENPGVEWKWTRKEATVTFRNPRRDSTFILQMDNPSKAPGGASEVEIRVGDQSVATVPVNADEAPVRKFALSAAQLGSGDMVEVRLVANRTFVPALEPATKSSDTRELGVRVFHAFVQPES